MLTRCKLLLPFTAMTALIISLPAQAQEVPGAWSGHYGADLGGGLNLRPRYEGSDELKVGPMPIVRAYYNGDAGRFAIGENGLSWAVHATQDTELGLSLGYNRGRKASASSELNGLGNIAAGAEAGAFGVMRFGPANVRLAIKTIASGSSKSNTTAELGAGYFYRVNDNLGLMPGVALTWANDKYMQRYFGVTAQQSYASGLSQYNAGAGFKSFGVGMLLRYRLTEHLHLIGTLRENLLIGDAADSPVTHSRLQPQAMVGVSYHWQHE